MYDIIDIYREPKKEGEDMSENQKNSPRDDDLDRFWDISSLMPKPRRAPQSRHPESVEAVEISLDAPVSEPKSHAEDGSRVQSSSLTRREISPSVQMKKDSDVLVKKFIPPHTADELDKAPPPEDEYTPEHSLIHRVRVFGKGGQYNYYEQFLSHAQRIARLRGNECEHVSFFSYVPQFSQLTKPQLNWYLWWRECVWSGKYLPTDFSYILLYIYEIINTAGHSNPAWGQRQLCFIWREYRRNYPRLDRLLGDWICDFSLLNHLSAPIDLIADTVSEALPSCTLKEFYMGGGYSRADGLPSTMLLTFCSNHSYKSSKFYVSDSKELYDTHIPHALEAVMDRFSSSDGRLMAGTGIEDSHMVRDAYSGALCSFVIRKRLEIDYSSFSRSYELRFIVTDVVKYAENKLRAYLGIKSRLSVYSLTPEMRKCIDEYFATALPGRKRSEPVREEYEKLYDAPRAQLSPEHAAQIEQTSWETTERLIEAFEESAEQTGECTSMPFDLPAPIQDAPMFVPDISSVTNAQQGTSALAEALGEYLDFVRLADAHDFAAQRRYAAGRGEMLELVIDKINEISVEVFGDVILEEADGGYVLIQEYRKEIFHD